MRHFVFFIWILWILGFYSYACASINVAWEEVTPEEAFSASLLDSEIDGNDDNLGVTKVDDLRVIPILGEGVSIPHSSLPSPRGTFIPSTGFVQRQIDVNDLTFIGTSISDAGFNSEDFVQISYGNKLCNNPIFRSLSSGRVSGNNVQLTRGEDTYEVLGASGDAVVFDSWLESGDVITIDAYGPLTSVYLKAFQGIDRVMVNGIERVVNDGFFNLPPGAHKVILPTAGIESEFIVHVHIVPQLDVVLQRLVQMGSTARIVFSLSGEPVKYPVSVNYDIKNSVNGKLIRSGVASIDSGLSAYLDIDVPDIDVEVENYDQFGWEITLDSAINAKVNDKKRNCLEITRDAIDQEIALTVSQQILSNSYERRVIFAHAGVVKIEVSPGSSRDAFQYDWSLTDNRVVPLNGFDQPYLNFDPSGMDPGLYTIHVQRIDEVSGEVVENQVAITIVNEVDLENNEAIVSSDVDDDGILSYADIPVSQNILPMEAGQELRSLAVGRPATQLALGNIAFQYQNQQAVLTIEQINEQISASELFPDTLESPVAFDIVIKGARSWGRETVVVPLGIKAEKLFIFDGKQNEWRDWNSVGRIRHASGVAGTCPFPDSHHFREYKEGYYLPCLEISVLDGDFNDADGLVNGEIALRMIANTISGNQDVDMPTAGRPIGLRFIATGVVMSGVVDLSPAAAATPIEERDNDENSPVWAGDGSENDGGGGAFYYLLLVLLYVIRLWRWVGSFRDKAVAILGNETQGVFK